MGGERGGALRSHWELAVERGGPTVSSLEVGMHFGTTAFQAKDKL